MSSQGNNNAGLQMTLRIMKDQHLVSSTNEYLFIVFLIISLSIVAVVGYFPMRLKQEILFIASFEIMPQWK